MILERSNDDELDDNDLSIGDETPQEKDSLKDDLWNDDLGLGLDGFGGSDAIPAMQKHSDLLKELTNFEAYIKDKVNGWLGLVWSEKESRYMRSPFIIPIMNKRGAAWCIDYLKTYTRKNNIITNISRREYEFIIIDVIAVVWMDIGTRMEDFGIKNNADLHRICVEMQHAAELILMGAGDGKYNKLLAEATSRHESINLSPHNQDTNNYGMETKKLSRLGKLRKVFFGS